jgi:hypothetical protein
LILRLFEGETACKANGVLRKELCRREKQNAWALLLASKLLAGRALRASHVLRDVIQEFAPFNVVETIPEFKRTKEITLNPMMMMMMNS